MHVQREDGGTDGRARLRALVLLLLLLLLVFFVLVAATAAAAAAAAAAGTFAVEPRSPPTW